MSGITVIFYLLCATGAIGTIVYYLRREDFSSVHKIFAVIYVLVIYGTTLLLGFLLKTLDSLITLNWKNYLYLFLNVIAFILLICSSKYLWWIHLFIYCTLVFLSNEHINIFLLLILANIEVIYIHFKEIKMTVSENNSEFSKDERYKILINLTFIAGYFVLVTLIFGSHFCIADGSGNHFLLGVESYFDNEWRDISLIQKIHGIFIASVLISYLTDILKKKLFLTE